MAPIRAVRRSVPAWARVCWCAGLQTYTWIGSTGVANGDCLTVEPSWSWICRQCGAFGEGNVEVVVVSFRLLRISPLLRFGVPWSQAASAGGPLGPLGRWWCDRVINNNNK